jgi:NDP-sugar pyrophosphorylase family protein
MREQRSKKGKKMHAVILAGGKGIRLRPYTTALPKPLVPIGDHHVILEIILEQLARSGFTSATLAINHLGRLIRAFVGDGAAWGLDIRYVEETTPLSTCGPLFGIPDLPEHFVVLNGDILTDLAFADLLDKHRFSGAPLTVATVTTRAKIDFGVLDIRQERICGFTEKPQMSYAVSTGIYAMSRSTIERYPAGLAYGFDQLILDLIREERYPANYEFTGYWSDIGRPEDYDEANQSFGTLRELLIPTQRQATA